MLSLYYINSLKKTIYNIGSLTFTRIAGNYTLVNSEPVVILLYDALKMFIIINR